jgi:hypothetical protein
MIGLSGGGWTTTLYAAIDPRVRLSFPVAGTLPEYLRVGRPGAREQFYPDLYKIANYLDLYVMGSRVADASSGRCSTSTTPVASGGAATGPTRSTR